MALAEAKARKGVLAWLVTCVWTLAVFVLLLVAVYIGIGRVLVSHVSAYEQDLESLLTERLGRPVQIDRLSGGWIGLDPIILVEGLTVGEGDKPDAALQRIRLRLATLSSLGRGRLVLSEFSASHADLTLTQDTKGVVGLSGLWQPPTDEITGLELLEAAVEDFDASFSGWIDELGKILADPIVRVSDLRLTLRTPDHPDQHYQIPAVDLAFRGGVFSAAGRLARVDNSETIAWFTLKGKHFFSGRFDGTLYLDVRSERLLDTFLQRYQWFDVGLQGLDLSTAAWLTFSGGEVSRVVARVDAPYLQLRTPDATLAPVQNLVVNLAASRLAPACASHGPCQDQPDQWEVLAQGLRFDWLDRSVGPTNARWLRSAGGGWELAIDRLALEGLADLLAALAILPEPATRALTGYRPKGEIEQLTMQYTSPVDYHLSMGLRQVGVDAFAGAPDIQGLDGWLEHNADGGRILFDSIDTVVGFPELFASAWQFERMSGEVAWAPSNSMGSGPDYSAWRVAGKDLRLRHGAETVFSGGFELILAPGQDPILGVHVGVENGREKHLRQFVPVKVVGEPLYDWITSAVMAAKVPWGWFYGYGALGTTGTRPESVPPFTSAMVYDFTQLAFAYAEDWPALEQGQGQFRYQGGLGWVDLESGRAGGLELEPSQIRIDSVESSPRITISSGAKVAAPDLKYWLANTALGPMAGDGNEVISAVEISGKADLDLQVVLLFPEAAASVESQVSASLALQELSIIHPQSGYQWQNLKGVIHYDSSEGLNAQAVTGRFLDHVARFSLAGGADARPVEVHQWGRATVAEIDSQLGIPVLWAEGEFDYDLRVSAGEQILLGFQLDLAGVAVDLPAPLAKTAGSPGLLQGNVVPESGGRIRLQGIWADRLAYQALWARGELEQASVVLGGETAPLQGTYFLGGTAESLNLDQWFHMLQPLIGDADNPEAVTATPHSQAPGSDGQVTSTNALITDADTERAESDAQATEPETLDPTTDIAGGISNSATLPIAISLSTQQLIVAGREFSSVGINLAPVGESWQVDLKGPDLAGSLLWRSEGPHSLMLERLRLHSGGAALDEAELDAKSDARSEHQDTLKANDKRLELPAADVAIRELWLDGANLGHWSFELRPSETALHVQGLRARTGSLAFTGDLIWQYGRDGSDLTRLKGELEGGDIRDLNAWVQGGVPLSSKSTRASLDLTWPGAPQAFSMAELSGEMALGLKDGSVLDQNNVAQVFRIFGILNADTLLRRLRLDFSDLYEAGVAFEALSGSAVVGGGTLTLDPELQLTGPSGAFRLTGSTDLLNETLNMRLVVILPLTQNLPVAALLFGAAAPVGGALFILDKLLGDPLSKLTSATYDVTGVWRQPTVKLRNMFDTGSDLRKYERPDIGRATDGVPLP